MLVISPASTPFVEASGILSVCVFSADEKFGVMPAEPLAKNCVEVERLFNVVIAPVALSGCQLVTPLPFVVNK